MLESLPYLRNFHLHINSVTNELSAIEILAYSLKKCARHLEYFFLTAESNKINESGCRFLG